MNEVKKGGKYLSLITLHLGDISSLYYRYTISYQALILYQVFLDQWIEMVNSILVLNFL